MIWDYNWDNLTHQNTTLAQFEVILTCFWSDLQGQLWPLTSFGGSDWIFSILTPNHPLMWYLKSFQPLFEVTSEVNFGLWPLLVGQIKYSQVVSCKWRNHQIEFYLSYDASKYSLLSFIIKTYCAVSKLLYFYILLP